MTEPQPEAAYELAVSNAGQYPRRSRLPAAERKAEIVESALAIAAEAGPGGVTTERLAARIGVTQAAIFRHFPKKEMIWSAVTDHLGAGMANAWKNGDDIGALPDVRLHAIALAHLRFLAATPGLVMILFSRELHVENAALRAGLRENQQRLHRLLAETTRQAVEAGLFRKSLLPDDGADLVIGVIQSLALRWSLSGRQFDLATKGERLLDALFDGFRCSALRQD